MSTFDENKEKLPDLEKFKDVKHPFLNDIYRKASRYNLSDKQIYAAQKAWDNIQAAGGKTPWEQNVEQYPRIQYIKDNLRDITNKISFGNMDFVVDLIEKAEKYKLSEKQINLLDANTRFASKEMDIFNISGIEKLLSTLKRCSPRSDFLYSLPHGLENLTVSDYNRIIKTAHKFKRCVWKRIFGDKK